MDEEDGYHDDNSGLWEADMDSELSDLEELEVQLYSQLHYQTEETEADKDLQIEVQSVQPSLGLPEDSDVQVIVETSSIIVKQADERDDQNYNKVHRSKSDKPVITSSKISSVRDLKPDNSTCILGKTGMSDNIDPCESDIYASKSSGSQDSGKTLKSESANINQSAAGITNTRDDAKSEQDDKSSVISKVSSRTATPVIDLSRDSEDSQSSCITLNSSLTLGSSLTPPSDDNGQDSGTHFTIDTCKSIDSSFSTLTSDTCADSVNNKQVTSGSKTKTVKSKRKGKVSSLISSTTTENNEQDLNDVTIVANVVVLEKKTKSKKVDKGPSNSDVKSDKKLDDSDCEIVIEEKSVSVTKKVKKNKTGHKSTKKSTTDIVIMEKEEGSKDKKKSKKLVKDGDSSKKKKVKKAKKRKHSDSEDELPAGYIDKVIESAAVGDEFISLMGDNEGSTDSIIINVETGPIYKGMTSGVLGSSPAKKKKGTDTEIDIENTDCTIADILDSLPDGDWSITPTDKYGRRSKAVVGRYYLPLNVKCNNCNERGHLSKICPKPKKVAVCLLCGLRGHIWSRCPSALCYNCYRAGHTGRECGEPRRKLWEACRTCEMQGHKAFECPNRWRQFHVTTSPQQLRQGKNTENEVVYCPNCGKEGHFHHDCISEMMDKRNRPTWPYIAQYRLRQDYRQMQESSERAAAQGQGQTEDADNNLPFMRGQQQQRNNRPAPQGFADNQHNRRKLLKVEKNWHKKWENDEGGNYESERGRNFRECQEDGDIYIDEEDNNGGNNKKIGNKGISEEFIGLSDNSGGSKKGDVLKKGVKRKAEEMGSWVRGSSYTNNSKSSPVRCMAVVGGSNKRLKTDESYNKNTHSSRFAFIQSALETDKETKNIKKKERRIAKKIEKKAMKKLAKKKEAKSSATIDLTSDPSTSKAQPQTYYNRAGDINRRVFNQYTDGDYFPRGGGHWWQGGSASHQQGAGSNNHHLPQQQQQQQQQQQESGNVLGRMKRRKRKPKNQNQAANVAGGGSGGYQQPDQSHVPAAAQGKKKKTWKKKKSATGYNTWTSNRGFVARHSQY